MVLSKPMSFWRIPSLNRYKDQIAAGSAKPEPETLPSLPTEDQTSRRGFLRDLFLIAGVPLSTFAGGAGTSLMQWNNGRRAIEVANKGAVIETGSSSDIYNRIVDPGLSAASLGFTINAVFALLKKALILTKMQELSELYLKTPSGTNDALREMAQEFLKVLQKSSDELIDINHAISLGVFKTSVDSVKKALLKVANEKENLNADQEKTEGTHLLKQLNNLSNFNSQTIPIVGLIVFCLHHLLKSNFKESVNDYAKAVAQNKPNKKLLKMRHNLAENNFFLSWLSLPSGAFSVFTFLAKKITSKPYSEMFNIGTKLSHLINDDPNSLPELKNMAREILVAMKELAALPSEEKGYLPDSLIPA